MADTNVTEFLQELGGGVFMEKLAHTLSEAALGTIVHGNGTKKGKVNIEFTFKQIGENDQVSISHKLAHITPTKRGKRSEEDTTETAMFVSRGGALSVSPPKEDLRGQFNLKQETDGKPLN